MEAKLGEDGLRQEGNHRVVLLLFFNDFVKHTAVVGMVAMGEDVLKLNFARSQTGLWFVAIRKHAEVKDGGAVVGFDQDRNVADA
jgi:hypothetical protein